MLLDEQVEKNYNEFMHLIHTNITRIGVDSLIKYLEGSDIKTAPASTRYHNAFKGGLIDHSLNVYKRLNQLITMEYPNNDCPYTNETITLVALLHDISKVNFYETLERNTKDEHGNWIKVPYYQVKDEFHRFIFGSHSMNSLYMTSKFFKLTYDEELAILHHMGGIDTTEDTLSAKNTVEAYKKSKLALLLHFADMMATTIDEVGLDA